MNNLVLNPVVEDAIVAISTTLGAWIIAHQFAWIVWG